ncbi:NADP-dependent oxidoreductase [Rhodospirillum rubrum]|uniref:NADP-dependent oxidoreductase n=1 Tax=Rhodospirillum rubrum TaxID=1085 RepID=UPI0019059641|nr:NADP-dependent oxidoreductase [Rhodospirillum rubrum]MBK1663364.1 NADP-dependent oxidoreductase [Rhodospirillum rubrum]MBK1675536.1 NADP-dependent oxidoreductase [Rhodospirillum rubrum]
MAQSLAENRQIVLARRPKGAPVAEDFRLETAPRPIAGDGQMLLRSLWLSLDPYMRGRMDDGPSYAAPVALGAVMVGGTVCRVEDSRLDGFLPGDLVLAYSGWQDYALSDGTGVERLEPHLDRPSLALGALGMPGLTAYVGLLDIGKPQPGETVVVAAATGAVGATVVQIAKLKGARVVAIAGGAKKTAYARETLGADVAIDHHDPAFAQTLATACPKGIDVYFENVGGKVFEAVLPLLNTGARVPLCGLIATYNGAGPDNAKRLPELMRSLLVRRITLRGFIIGDHRDRIPAFQKDMAGWLASGQIIAREDVVDGLERAPAAFIGLLEGGNFGKLVVAVG